MLIIDNQFPALCSRASCDYSVLEVKTREKVFSSRDKLFEYRSFSFNYIGEMTARQHGEIPAFPSFLSNAVGRERRGAPPQTDRLPAPRRLPRQSSAPGSTAHFRWARNQVSFLLSCSLRPFPLFLFSSFPCHSLFFFISLSLFFKRQADNNASVNKVRCYVNDIIRTLYLHFFLISAIYF